MLPINHITGGTVLSKDLSRLGRNYIESGSYIEIFFPQHNVRYIAVNDGVDTINSSEMDITPFKNILNEMYSRDISKKIKSGKLIRAQQGKFMGVTAPFGLKKDPADKNHLIIDEETAPTVRFIYMTLRLRVMVLCVSISSLKRKVILDQPTISLNTSI